MITNLFPITIFRSKVLENEKIKEICLPFVEEEYEKEPSTFTGYQDSDVFTTFDKDFDFPWEEVLNQFVPNIEEMCGEYGIKGQVGINTAWFNAFKSGQFHSTHDHLPSSFSAVYYLKYDPEIHTPTIYLNPYRQVSLFTAPDRDRDPSVSPPMWTGLSALPVEEGDLVIFPGFLEHKVPRQTSNELRVTLSFNFNLYETPKSY